MYARDDLLATHISLRLPFADHQFLINPLGFMFEEISASALVKVDLQGNIRDGSEHSINPAGFIIHSTIHAARPDAQCIIHLHTVPGVAVSCQEKGLMPLNQTALILNDKIAYHEYEGIALDPAEQQRLVADLGSKNTMILRNHGTLAVGRSVAEAFQSIYFLERACAIQIAALTARDDLHEVTEPVHEVVRRQAASFGDIADRLLWPALLRKLDRFDTSYRD